jgi:hypothetical protein
MYAFFKSFDSCFVLGVSDYGLLRKHVLHHESSGTHLPNDLFRAPVGTSALESSVVPSALTIHKLYLKAGHRGRLISYFQPKVFFSLSCNFYWNFTVLFNKDYCQNNQHHWDNDHNTYHYIDSGLPVSVYIFCAVGVVHILINLIRLYVQ